MHQPVLLWDQVQNKRPPPSNPLRQSPRHDLGQVVRAGLVSFMLRVVRWNSRTPIRASSAAIARDADEASTLRLLATGNEAT